MTASKSFRIFVFLSIFGVSMRPGIEVGNIEIGYFSVKQSLANLTELL